MNAGDSPGGQVSSPGEIPYQGLSKANSFTSYWVLKNRESMIKCNNIGETLAMLQKRQIATLGKFIRYKRKQKGLSLAQAERRSGVDFTYWSRLELDLVKSPNPRHLAAVAHALDVPIQELYGMAGYYLPEKLPSLAPYLRAKYGLDSESIVIICGVFDDITSDGRGESADRRAS